MKLLSVVVPSTTNATTCDRLLTAYGRALHDAGLWELILVDDGSSDDTFAELESVAASEPRVKVVRLRRNFGQSAATQAGLDAAAGDVIATMDGDLQNDPADIPLMVAKLDEGYDAVLGQRLNRQDKLLLREASSSGARTGSSGKVLNVPFKDFGCAVRDARRDVASGLMLYGEMHRFITALPRDSARRQGGPNAGAAPPPNRRAIEIQPDSHGAGSAR
ncbi:MAG: glycosyltransferase family 2 protein [Gemmataceae bacterium]